MLPVYESKDAFLYYPIQYEAQECSNNIFYTGATPNQQSEPATDFMYKRSPAAGGDFFLVGSDYVFPRTSNTCLLYTSPSPRDATLSRMPSSA